MRNFILLILLATVYCSDHTQKGTNMQNPFGDLNALDILGKRKDGGVDAIIVAVGSVSADTATQTALLDKVQNYLGYINSQEFADKFGPPSRERVRIIVRCETEPDPVIRELVKKSEPWANENHATLMLEVKQ